MSLSERDRLIQLAQTIEDIGGATALLARTDSRYVPQAFRARITQMRQDLSVLFGDMLRELRAIEGDLS